MNLNIEIDIKDFVKGVDKLNSEMSKAVLSGVNDIASEVLRLSSFEAPHDTGSLQTSGHVEPSNDVEVVVGYNKVYAARLHEHPEYRFQKGRKGKYLEDPIKNNYSIFIEYMKNSVSSILK